MDQERYYHAFLGTNSMRGSKGIYHVSIRKEDLDFQVEHTCQSLNGDYVCLSPDQKTLYADYELIYYNGKPTGAAGAYHIGEDGSLTLLNTINLHGQMECLCSVSRDGKRFLSSSYMTGSVSIAPIREDGSLDPEIEFIQQPVREAHHWPSTHSVYETVDGRYVLSTNVGLDRVFLHERTADGWVQAYEVEVKGRPRQAAFSADGKLVYVSTESGGEVYVLAYDPDAEEKLSVLQIISTAPAGFTGNHVETAGIKLSPNGRMLVVTNRCPDLNNLAVFAVNPETRLLTSKGWAEVHGVFPRDLDFTPDSKYLLVALQFSDSMEIYEADYENTALISRKSDIAIPCCSGVRFMK